MSGSGTPEQVLKSIVDGINAGNLDALMLMARSCFAASWDACSRLVGVRQSLAAFIGMKGTLDLK
jgi:hypothetical protein